MPSKAAEAALRDMHHHLQLIAEFVAGFDRNQFEGDRRTTYAVIRCLEVISEASRRLPDDLKGRHPHIAWKQIASAGNAYRHDYEDIAPARIWDTLQFALPSLAAAVSAEIARLA